MSGGAMAMGVSDGGGGGGGRGGGRGAGGPLAVNKASSKVAKPGLRRPVTQPRPAPHIYKTEPGDFRSLVQQLTGTCSSSSSSSGAALAPGPAPTKPAVLRLHKIAPPPLRPTFAYPTTTTTPLPTQQQQQQNAAAAAGAPPPPLKPPALPISSAPGFSPSRFGGFSPHSTQRVSPFPVSPLSFSPLPALTPSDYVWASTWSSSEFPKDSLLQQQQQQQVQTAAGAVAAAAGQGNNNNNSISRQDFSMVDATGLSAMRFPAPPLSSPKFAIPFGLPSPTGFGGFGIFGMSSNFSPTAANFSFLEPDII